MQMTLGFVMFTAALVSAAPSIRRDDGVNCGSSHYSLQAIEEASKTACYYVKRDEQVPGFTFPGKFDNIEKFDFKGAPGPFYTFPILSSGNVYVGGMSSTRSSTHSEPP